MKSAVAIIVIAILTVSSLVAQVHIKENATIVPRQAKKLQDVVNNPNKFNFQIFTNPSIISKMEVDLPCGTDTMFYSLGQAPLIAELDSPMAGSYSFWVIVCTTVPDILDSITDNVSFDGTMLYLYHPSVIDYFASGSGLGACGTYYAASFTTPYSSSFDLSLSQAQLSQGDTAGMSIGGYDDCSRTAWFSTDPMTLTIVSGSQYLSFHMIDTQTGTDTKLGSVVTTTGNNAGQYSLVADGIAPDSSGDWATIQAESDGIIKTDSIRIFPLIDHFYVYFAPDTIMHQAWATIYVQPENSAGNDITIPGNTPLNITAGDSGTYGEFYDSQFNMPYLYSDVSTGAVQYFSDGAYPGDMQKIAVTVTDANDPSKSGGANLFVEGDIMVQVTPSQISPGDTASIIVMHRNWDGSLSDFSQDQSFEVGIDSGSTYGTILSSGGTGGNFASIPQPFQFIAADSIGADSVMVSIRVGYQPAVASSTLPGGKGKLGLNMKAKPMTISTKIERPGLKSSANKV
ncbi:MAG: hypothetical protein WAO19_14255, partial [Candidatus Kryptoniota bacterium]